MPSFLSQYNARTILLSQSVNFIYNFQCISQLYNWLCCCGFCKFDRLYYKLIKVNQIYDSSPGLLLLFHIRSPDRDSICTSVSTATCGGRRTWKKKLIFVICTAVDYQVAIPQGNTVCSIGELPICIGETSRVGKRWIVLWTFYLLAEQTMHTLRSVIIIPIADRGHDYHDHGADADVQNPGDDDDVLIPIKRPYRNLLVCSWSK